ncbi:MAG TPA: gliding motility-associated C-terminal domain-containing protein, partial [Bacteroidia bacterium]|nr:gliding motility-associated C-terminal domain-containing protein [Bacteroidia bacterium]
DSGKYSVQAKNGACLEDTSISIILKPSPTVITNGTQTVCLGDTVVLTAAGGTNYTWSSGSTTSNIVVRPVSNKTYSVAVSNGICSIDTTILVTVHPKPKPIIKGNSPICFGDSTVLTAKGGTSYSWNTGATSSSLKVKPAQTSTYSVAISNSFCTVDTSISIAVKPLPNTVITGNTSICLGQSSSLTALGGASYSWSTGATESSINISPVSNSEYWVVVDTNGCTDSVFQWVIVNPLPVISACCDSNIVLGQNIQLTSSGGVNYSWVPASGLSCDNCSNPIASPAVSTIYTLTVTSDSACSSITTITIDVNCGTVFVPEAFSPNGDGQNDNLYVRGDCIKVLDFIVFDRWGKRIFETTDKDIPWDGTSKGQALNTGSYVYSLSATLYDGTNIQRKGNVALVR